MSLELIREAAKVNQVIGEDSAQTVIENDIIVPDIKPDIARILLLDGDTYVNRAEAAQDKILVNGTIRFKILYISDDNSTNIKSINAGSNFSYALDARNSRAGAKCRVKCDIEHIEYNVLNGRKLNIKTILKISGKVVDEIEQNLINNLTSVEDAQVLKDNIRINCYLGESSSDYTVREALEVPAGKPTIKEILRTDVKITAKDYKITDNKVIAKGELNISTLYAADDEEQSVQIMEHEIPFAQFIDLAGISEDSYCNVEYRISDAQFEPAEDSDGELRVLNSEVVLNLFAEGFDKKTFEVITDAYSPRIKLNIEKEPFKTEEIAAESKAQIVLKDTITTRDDDPEISQVFNVLCKPVISEYRIQDDKLTVEGLVNGSMLYLANSEEHPISCYEQEIPFRHTVDIKGIKPGMECDINLDVEHSSYSMVSANEVEVRLVIGLNAKAVRQVVLPLTVKITESAIEDRKIESQPSIIVYFSKPGDTLWKIAKKYYTTVDYIQSINNVTDQDLLNPGRQVIIPKKV